jgi:hypothetical protein
MSVVERIESLRARHAALEKTIHDEEVRPHPDDDVITDLKKKKLRIKDELASLETETRH